MSNLSHVISVTRTIALLAGMSALGACSVSATSGDSGTTDSASTDTQVFDTATNDASDVESPNCAACTCAGFEIPDAEPFDSGLPVCVGVNAICCAAVGPVPPPDLPV